jgi:predicted MPP superfamily phosphohydrolase
VSWRRPLSERLCQAVLRRPFDDELGRKGWLGRFCNAQPHVLCRHTLTIAGWPRLPRALRVAFLSDLHVGSHAGDVARLARIADEAAALAPDLALFGGDYINMQLFGGGRVPPRVVAALLARIKAPLGRFAILGNHDYVYGEVDVAAALTDHGIIVLDHARHTVTVGNHALDIVGLPDAHVVRPQLRPLLDALSPEQPAIVLTHDPVWFKHVPPGPFLTLAGHTHGGQIRLPGIGVLKNSSRAPLRWTHGLIAEEGRFLYVSAGLGTSAIPLRIGVPPEFAVIDINGPDQNAA